MLREPNRFAPEDVDVGLSWASLDIEGTMTGNEIVLIWSFNIEMGTRRVMAGLFDKNLPTVLSISLESFSKNWIERFLDPNVIVTLSYVTSHGDLEAFKRVINA